MRGTRDTWGGSFGQEVVAFLGALRQPSFSCAPQRTLAYRMYAYVWKGGYFETASFAGCLIAAGLRGEDEQPTNKERIEALGESDPARDMGPVFARLFCAPLPRAGE